jgi:hypothetical protein
MKNKSAIAAVIALLATTVCQAKPTCQNPTGEWKNQLNSTLSITSYDAATGQLSGTYISPSGGGTSKFPLVGWLNVLAPQPSKHNVTIVSFSVRWGTFGSVTSWTGTCVDVSGTARLTTLWQLGRSNSDFEWDHVLAGTDLFSPQ